MFLDLPSSRKDKPNLRISDWKQGSDLKQSSTYLRAIVSKLKTTSTLIKCQHFYLLRKCSTKRQGEHDVVKNAVIDV